MRVQNPNFRELATAIFHNANFINDLGINLRDLGPGLIVAESEVYANQSGKEKLVAKAMVTLAVVRSTAEVSSRGV